MKQLIFYILLILLSTQSIAQDFWMPLEVPENFVGRSMATNSLGWLFVGTNDGVYRSTNNGENLVKVGLNNVIGGLTIDSYDNVYAGSNPIYLSTNSGVDWSVIPTPSDVECIFKNDNMILYGNWGEICKTTDNGENWAHVLLGNCVVNSIVENIDGTMFAGTTNFFGGGGVYQSLDSGDTWEYIGLTNKFISSLATNSEGTIFVGSRGDYAEYYGGVYTSNDSGSTWEELRNDILVTSIAISPNNEIYVGCSSLDGSQGGVFRSTNNGETWELINSGMTGYPNVEGLAISPNGYLYAYSDLLYRSTNPVFTSITPNTYKSESIQVYPNPFSNILNIRLAPYQTSHNIWVYSHTGCLVYQNSIISHDTLTLNLENLSKGIYFLVVEVGNQIVTRLIVKQ